MTSAALGPSIRVGCQTYSWQMSLDTYRGRVGHMAAVAAGAGFGGFEPEVIMLGDGWSASALRSELDRHGIALAALCLAESWLGPAETEAEAQAADRAIEAVALTGGVLNLCQLPGADRAGLAQRQRNALACLAAVSGRAADRGVRCTFHPNSPDGSVFRTAEDYEILLAGLPERVGFTPDLGHIVKGGMVPLEVLSTYRDRVDHVHYKDIDPAGDWAPTGLGVIDFAEVTRYLAETGYAGWIVMEDESPQAQADPDGAARRNAEYARVTLGLR
jgi:inosose dehydratase